MDYSEKGQALFLVDLIRLTHSFYFSTTIYTIRHVIISFVKYNTSVLMCSLWYDELLAIYPVAGDSVHNAMVYVQRRM